MLISGIGISEISRKVRRIQISGGHVGIALGGKVILIEGGGFLVVVVSGQVAVAG